MYLFIGGVMKIAIIGSRNLKNIVIDDYIKTACEIVSGGAAGIDSLAADYANRKGIKLVEFLPEYNKYGRAAPIIRNKEIVNYADKVIAFWDGKSKGTEFTIKYAKSINKECTVIIV